MITEKYMKSWNYGVLELKAFLVSVKNYSLGISKNYSETYLFSLIDVFHVLSVNVF